MKALTTICLIGILAAAIPAWGQHAVNAALPSNGARVSMRMLDPKGGKDPNTAPEDTTDGNPHTRCVVWGAPYAFTIDLVERIPVQSVAITLDDYDTETAPKDVEVRLDDGTTFRRTLELLRPDRQNRFPRQLIPVSRPTRSVQVTVTSTYPGQVNYGGIGEIEVMTTVDLTPLLKVAGYDPAAPAYVRNPLALLAAEPAPKVTMPPRAQPGQHPRLLLTPGEVDTLKQQARTLARAKKPYAVLLDGANALAGETPSFPDPAGTPAQLKDRWDPIGAQHDKLSRGVETLGLAYQLTGDRRYAARARDILLGYAERYQQYPLHKGVNAQDSAKVYAQRLSEAMWLLPQIIGADYIWDTLSAADRQKIADGLFRPATHLILSHQERTFAQVAAELDRSDPGWRTAGPKPPTRPANVGNWEAFYNATYVTAGCLLDDDDLRDVGVYGARSMILNGISPDGMWNEGAIGYQMFALQAFMIATEAAARAGIDLYSYQNCRLKQLFDSPLRYAYPDSTMPGIHDSGRSGLYDWSSMVYDFAYLRYGDSRYATIIDRAQRQMHASEGVYYLTRVYEPVKAGSLQRFPSAVFGGIGYAVLREGSGKNQQYLLMDYGPHGGVHGHLDKLHLVYYADGDELGGEPQFHRYEDPLHHEWTYQSLGHGTMCVDGRSQMPCEGRLIAFAPGDAAGLMRGVTDAATPGVLLDRTAVLTQEYLLDLFRVRGMREHVYDLPWLLHGDLQGLPAPAKASPALGERDGYENVGVLRRGMTGQDWTRVWSSSVSRLTLRAAAEPGTEVIDGRDPDGRSIVVARRKATATVFVSALQRTGSKRAIRSLERLPGIGAAEGAAARVTLQDGTTDLALIRERPGPSAAGGIRTDGLAVFVRLSAAGKLVSAHLVGGTYLEGKGFRIDAGKRGVATVERGADGKMALAPGGDAGSVTWRGTATK